MMLRGSWKPTPHSIARDKELSPNAFRVWSVIRSHEDKRGQAQLSNATLAAESRMDPKTVQRAKKELAGKGLLQTLFQPKGRGQGACSYSTNDGIQGGLKRFTKEKELTLPEILSFVVTPEWERRMHAKHSCHGCGHCHECRTNDAALDL